MVSAVTNIPGYNQKVDSKVTKPPSADDSNTQTSITGNEQDKEMAAVTPAEPSQQEQPAAAADEKVLEAKPQVPGPVLSAYKQSEDRVGMYVDKIV